MKMIKGGVLLAAVFLSYLSSATTGTEGHGGDPLRTLFEEARGYAVARVTSARACAFSIDTKPEVIAWIMEHQAALATDIQLSPHIWITDHQSTCAYTQTSSQAPITLSFETCRPNIEDVNDAIQMLAHESVHHFNVIDENFADQVGTAIQRLGINARCEPEPSEDPFDPNSCPGRRLTESELKAMIPLPERNSVELGKFTATIRQRTCYGMDFCSSWRGDDRALTTHSESNPFVVLGLEGSVELQYAKNRPQVALREGTAMVSPDWGLTSTIQENDVLQAREAHAHSGLFLNYVPIDPLLISKPRISGWITPTCFRQGVAVKREAKDNRNNDVVIETEMIILSKFAK